MEKIIKAFGTMKNSIGETVVELNNCKENNNEGAINQQNLTTLIVENSFSKTKEEAQDKHNLREKSKNGEKIPESLKNSFVNKNKIKEIEKAVEKFEKDIKNSF